MKRHKLCQQVMGVMLIGLLLVGCGAETTSDTTVEPIEPTVVPTVEPTVEPTIEPTIEPTVEPTESAPIGATVILLGEEGSYTIDMYSQVSSPLPIMAQLPGGNECEVLSGPRAIAGTTLWELDCSWSDEVDTEGWGLIGWVDVAKLEVIDLEPLPEYDPDTILVTFDGEECTSTVPAELPVGEHQFVFRNLSDLDFGFYGLWVCRLIDGHTYQELIDRQTHPGVQVQNPSWCPFPIWQLIEENGPSDKVSIHQLEEVGEHAIFVGTWPRKTGTWFCGSFQVVEAPSE